MLVFEHLTVVILIYLTYIFKTVEYWDLSNIGTLKQRIYFSECIKYIIVDIEFLYLHCLFIYSNTNNSIDKWFIVVVIDVLMY